MQYGFLALGKNVRSGTEKASRFHANARAKGEQVFIPEKTRGSRLSVFE
jgi:hypothetical protein